MTVFSWKKCPVTNKGRSNTPHCHKAEPSDCRSVALWGPYRWPVRQKTPTPLLVVPSAEWDFGGDEKGGKKMLCHRFCLSQTSIRAARIIIRFRGVGETRWGEGGKKNPRWHLGLGGRPNLQTFWDFCCTKVNWQTLFCRNFPKMKCINWKMASGGDVH